jgi:putative ABC transport system permease protein
VIARGWLTRIRGLFTGASDEARLNEEAAAHLDELTSEYQRRGLTPEEARAAARREFGNLTAIREIHREQRRLPFFDPLARDLRYALRQLRAKPGFAATVVLTLALGIGANTAIFQVLDAVALRMLPVKNPEQLVSLELRQSSKSSHATFANMSYPLFRELAVRQRSLAGLIASASIPPAEREQDGLQARLASGDYFQVLGVQGAIGRVLLPGDDRPFAPPACVISYAYWQHAFGGEAGAVGRTLRVNDAKATIVGVAPRGFFGEFVGSAPDVWLPMNMQPLTAPDHANWLVARPQAFLSPIGRLKPGVSLKRAEAEMSSLYSELHELSIYKRAESYSVHMDQGGKGRSQLRSQFSTPLEILMGIAGLVLLMACCNLANLLLAHTSSRTHEMGVRLALGAGRARLLRQLLTESGLLATVGAALGFALAGWGSRALVTMASMGQDWRIDLTPDGRLLAFTAAISTAAVFLFGLAPAILSARVDVHASLQANRRTSGGRGRLTLTRFFVTAQTAVSLMLVTGAALLAHSFHKLETQDFGYRQEGLLLVQFKIDRALLALRNAERMGTLQERLSAIPGVRSAAVGGPGPLAQMQSDVKLSTPEVAGIATDALQAKVSTHYFETMRIPILAGRAIAEEDRGESAPVAVLSETAAHRLFGGANPVGRMVTYENGQQMEVVGVAHDVRANNPREEFLPIVYVPMAQQDKPILLTAALRTAGDPASFVAAAREAVRDATPGIRIESIMPLTDALAEMMGRDRMVAELSGGFGLLALALASAGLYGVIAYSVERRTQELGIRLALGAERAQVTAMLLGEIGRLLCAGLAAGLCGTLALSGLLRASLFGLAPYDPATLAGAAALLSAVGLTAAYLPARRAGQLDPMAALRVD